MEKLKIGKTIINYEMKPDKRAKRIKIRIVKGQVKVSFPPGTDKKRVKEFVESQKEWIIKTLGNYQNQKEQRPLKIYQEGEEYLFRGKKYQLRIKSSEGIKATVKLLEDSILILLPKDADDSNRSSQIKEILVSWYRDEAKRVYKSKLEHYALLMDCKYNQLRVKNQSTRWGSCSTKGNINLNWRIIMAPDEVINYLIVHELAHLKHMNHSQDFWNFVAIFMPDFAIWRKWLKDNGKFLSFENT
ncbi:MAG: M48 family metallopeptidase [Peptococcales bacterium]